MRSSLLVNNIPTLYAQIQVNLTGATRQNIGQILPTQIGQIYGIANVTGGKTRDNLTIASYTDAQNIFITLSEGATVVFDSMRLDMFSYNQGSDAPADTQYAPVNIRGEKLSLDKCFVDNPTGVAKSIVLGLWYIPRGQKLVTTKK